MERVNGFKDPVVVEITFVGPSPLFIGTFTVTLYEIYL